MFKSVFKSCKNGQRNVQKSAFKTYCFFLLPHCLPRRWILKSLFLENDASFRERGSYTEVIVVAKSLSPTGSCSTEKVAFLT